MDDFLELARAVGALHRALLDVGEDVAAAAGLSQARSACLRTIADEPLTVAAIAARQGVARQGVQRLADLLVADGVARYLENPRHRRAKLLAPTPAGHRALAAMDRAHHDWVAHAGHTLGELGLPELTDRLRTITDAVHRLPAPRGTDAPQIE